MTVCLNYDIEMLRNLKALYKYTDRFLTIERENETDRERETNRERDGGTETETDWRTDNSGRRQPGDKSEEEQAKK